MDKKRLIELLTAMRNKAAENIESSDQYFALNTVLQILTDDAYAAKMEKFYLGGAAQRDSDV